MRCYSFQQKVLQSFTKKESVKFYPTPLGHLYINKPKIIVGINKIFDITGRIL